jgi:hypothetical protein
MYHFLVPFSRAVKLDLQPERNVPGTYVGVGEKERGQNIRRQAVLGFMHVEPDV